MPEDLKDLVNRLYDEAIIGGKYEVIDELVAPGYVGHGMPMPISGPSGFRQSVESFRDAFPDLHMLIEEQIIDGDRVSERGYLTGTQRNEFLGFPPSGNQIKVNLAAIWRFEDGKLAESWVQMDLMGLMQQIGAIPVPG